MEQDHDRFGHALAGTLLLAGAYALTGWLGLMLAVPPGFATPVWPPSGLALAGVLHLGHRAWPGVWLGSFVINLSQSLNALDPLSMVQSFGTAAAIGAGAAMQAAGGAWLIRERLGYPTALAEAREVFRFLLLAGPVSCLINATWSVNALLIAGAVSWTDAPFNWLTWWVGDTIGVLVFVPMLMTFTSRPRVLWQRRRLAVALPLAITFALAVALFLHAKRREDEQLAALVQQRASEAHRAISEKLTGTLEALQAIEPLLIHSREISPETFRQFVRPAMERYPAIRSVEGIVRLAADKRDAGEQAARAYFPGFEVKELGADNRLVRAGLRAEHFPAVFIEPLPGNEARIGYDLGSEPGLRAAMDAAAAVGQLIVSPGASLLPAYSGGKTVLAFVPVYEPGFDAAKATEESRRNRLLAFVLAAIHTERLVESSLRTTFTEGLALRLEDVSGEHGPEVLYESSPQAGPAADPAAAAVAHSLPTWQGYFQLRGRVWRLEAKPTPEFVAASRGWESWLVLFTGLVFTSLLGSLLLVVTGRTVSVELLVEERTDALRASKQQLEREVAERRRAEAELVALTATLEERVSERTRALKETAQAALNMMEDAQWAWRKADFTAQALLQSEEQFRLVVEAAANAMIMVDEQGRICLANHQAEVLFGYTRMELLGQPVEMLVPERFRAAHPGLRSGFHGDPKARPMGAGRDLFGLRKDGVEVPVEIGLSPLAAPEGMFVLATIIDIRERKHSEEMIRAKNQELESLLYVISHDLREPLRAMENFSDLLIQRHGSRLDEKGQDFLARIARAARRMQRLLDDLLAVSRIRRLGPATQEVVGEKAVRNALDRLGTRIRQTRARVTVADDLPVFRGDPAWVTEAVYNLMSNALKFTRPGEPPDIEVEAYHDAKAAAPVAGIVVKDRGPGIASEHRERIFELFQRAVGREIEGTGAGLAIVREVAVRHGGQAWAQPRPGGGSMFVITFGPAGCDETQENA